MLVLVLVLVLVFVLVLVLGAYWPLNFDLGGGHVTLFLDIFQMLGLKQCCRSVLKVCAWVMGAHHVGRWVGKPN